MAHAGGSFVQVARGDHRPTCVTEGSLGRLGRIRELELLPSRLDGEKTNQLWDA